MLQQAFGDECMSRMQCFEWYSRLKTGRTLIDEGPGSGRSSTSTRRSHRCSSWFDSPKSPFDYQRDCWSYVAVLFWSVWGKPYAGRGLSSGWTKVGCCITTMHQLTRRSLCAIFWRKTKRPLYPSHPTLQIWLQRTFFCFLSWSLPWKDAILTHLTRSRKIRRRSCSPFRKKHSKVGRNVGSGVLLAKETTLKATKLNKLYLSTYSFYYNSPVFYWSYLVEWYTTLWETMK